MIFATVTTTTIWKLFLFKTTK